MLRKLLEKVFITKKCTQCKTSHTSEIVVFELPDNKNIRKFFSKYKLLFLGQSDSRSDPSQILILQYPIPGAFLSPSPSLWSYTLVNWNPSSTQSSSYFPILLYIIRPHATTSIGYTNTYAKPSHYTLLSSYIQIIIYYGSNHGVTIHQKTESLTLSWRRPVSYRNQSIDNGPRHERVKSCFSFKFSQHVQQQLYLQYKEY